MWAALLSLTEGRDESLTASMNIAFLRPCGPGPIIAENEPDSLTKLQAFPEADAILPELAAAVKAAIVGVALPGPSSSPHGQVRRSTGEVGFGWMTPLLPNEAARRNNELR